MTHFVFAPTVAGASPLTSQEQQGRRIYQEGGDGESGGIVAVFGRTGIEVSASLLPCAGCHGEDGLGQPEGGIEPAKVTWQELIKPYGHRHGNGRRHGAFDEASLVAAIAQGIDPAGNALDTAMPKYRMSEGQISALIAYLKRLDRGFDPGLTETTIKVGSLLPREGRYGARGRAIEALLRAYFAEINADGGVYGRHIVLEVAEFHSDRAATLAEARRLVEEEEVFALVGAFAIGVEQPLFAFLGERQVPQVGPYTLLASDDHLPGRATFFLESGLPLQAQALINFGAQTIGIQPAGVALVLMPSNVFEPVVAAVRQQAAYHAWPQPIVARPPDGDPKVIGLAGQLAREGVEAVLFFGAAQGLRHFAADAAQERWYPHLLMPGLIAGEAGFDLPAGFAGRAHVAYPGLASDLTPAGRAELDGLRRRHGLTADHLPAQSAALGAAKVLVEGLSRAGRGLSRSALVASLEQLSGFETGVMRPVSFGPGRRVGTRGSQVLTVDLERRAFGGHPTWVEVE